MKTAGQFSSFSSRSCDPVSIVSEEHAGVKQIYVQRIQPGRTATWCHHEVSGPEQRKAKPFQRSGNTPVQTWTNNRVSFLTLLFVLVLCLNGVVAQERVHPALQKLAGRGKLLVDRSPPPGPPHRRVLMARGSSKPTTSAPSASPTLVGSSASTSNDAAAAASSATGIITAPGSISSALPQPFDSSIGNNFTSTACPAYFTKFLADPVFQSCYPFSLLIQVSTS
jgi:hypothetical protein